MQNNRPHPAVSRREMIRTSGAALVTLASWRPGAAQEVRALTDVPVRQITRGPKFHWFGYYDKLEFDPTGRYVLGMEVDFEHRSPTARRRDQGRHGRPAGRRPLDRAGREPRLVLAAGLHAAVAARLRRRGALERPRGRPLRLPHA